MLSVTAPTGNTGGVVSIAIVGTMTPSGLSDSGASVGGFVSAVIMGNDGALVGTAVGFGAGLGLGGRVGLGLGGSTA